MPSASPSAATTDSTIEETAVERPFVPSEFQRPVFDWFANRVPGAALIVRARAGTGKTTTILRAIDFAPEENILLAAFNKRIQEELAAKLTNPNAKALTLHSLGYRAIRNAGGVARTCKRFEREEDISNAVSGGLGFGAKRLVGKLVTKAREIQPLDATRESLVSLAFDFGLVPGPHDGYGLEQLADATLRGLEYAKDPASQRKTGIDFADMIFLPLVLDYISPDFDMVVVDEAQDMTTAQLTLALRSCKPEGRTVLVGDDRQAIYGFRGADSQSLDRLKGILDADELPLSKTYRCPKGVVAIAKQFVPDYTVDAGAPAGVVDRLATSSELVSVAKAGDFILSRRNAPLVGITLNLLKNGISARIAGRDIGQMLKSLVKSLAKGQAEHSIPAFLRKLGEYRDRMATRLLASGHEHQIEALDDKVDTLVSLAQASKSVPALIESIEMLFVDDLSAYVICSSVHKAKGLEANRVFILEKTFFMAPTCAGCKKWPKRCTCKDGYVPDPKAKQEEANIYYVAVTRAKKHLTMVEDL